MTKSEFLYHFTKIYLSEAVKETFLIESWEEKDFDHRYVEYADIFITLRDKYFVTGSQNKELIHSLSKDKNNIVAIFNKTITGHFMDELKKQGCYNEAMAKEFIRDKIPLGGNINPHILEIFRGFEEKVFDQKQERA